MDDSNLRFLRTKIERNITQLIIKFDDILDVEKAADIVIHIRKLLKESEELYVNYLQSSYPESHPKFENTWKAELSWIDFVLRLNFETRIKNSATEYKYKEELVTDEYLKDVCAMRYWKIAEMQYDSLQRIKEIILSKLESHIPNFKESRSTTLGLQSRLTFDLNAPQLAMLLIFMKDCGILHEKYTQNELAIVANNFFTTIGSDKSAPSVKGLIKAMANRNTKEHESSRGKLSKKLNMLFQLSQQKSK